MKLELALCVVYNDFSFLVETIDSVKDKLKHIWFIVPYQMWHGAKDQSGNSEVLRTIDRYLEENSTWKMIRQNVKNQSEALNLGLTLAEKHFDSAMILDSDEIWTEEEFSKLLSALDDKYDVFTINSHTYFKRVNYRIDPPQRFTPPVVVKTSVRFVHARKPNSSNVKHCGNVYYHHPSHVRPDHMMKMKCESCSERANFRDWYDKVWLQWTPDMKNFHPTLPKSFHQVKIMSENEIPEILRKYI